MTGPRQIVAESAVLSMRRQYTRVRPLGCPSSGTPTQPTPHPLAASRMTPAQIRLGSRPGPYIFTSLPRPGQANARTAEHIPELYDSWREGPMGGDRRGRVHGSSSDDIHRLDERPHRTGRAHRHQRSPGSRVQHSLLAHRLGAAEDGPRRGRPQAVPWCSVVEGTPSSPLSSSVVPSHLNVHGGDRLEVRACY